MRRSRRGQAIVVTHPEFPSQNLSARDQHALAERGALPRALLHDPYTGKTTWEHGLREHRKSGPEHSFVSTDLGQPFNPPVETGFALIADRLLEAGFSDEEIHTMCVGNTRRLAGPREPAHSGDRRPLALTSCGGPGARSRRRLSWAGRPRSWRSHTASAASRANSGRSRDQTIENVKKIRHAEAERRPRRLGASFQRARPRRLPAARSASRGWTRDGRRDP